MFTQGRKLPASGSPSHQTPKGHCRNLPTPLCAEPIRVPAEIFCLCLVFSTILSTNSSKSFFLVLHLLTYLLILLLKKLLFPLRWLSFSAFCSSKKFLERKENNSQP